MAGKADRHTAVLDIIGSNGVASQEELRKLLHRRGISVTQATLSRDLHELGIVRVPAAEGSRYALPEMVHGETIPSLESLLPQLFSRVSGVGELIVLHTLPSGAQPISEAIDAAGWKDILGTIAGENTILIVCRSEKARLEVTARLQELARGA